jgi:hypothetical protein
MGSDLRVDASSALRRIEVISLLSRIDRTEGRSLMMCPNGRIADGDRFPVLQSRGSRPFDSRVDEARRVLWRTFQHGTLNEEEFASATSTVISLQSGQAIRMASW